MKGRYGELHPLHPGFLWNLLRALRRQEIEPRNVGYGYLVLGGLTSLGALGALAAPERLERPLPPPLEAMRPFFDHLGSVAVAQVALGVVVVLSSVAFVRGHGWSRIGLDLFNVLLGGWAIYFGILWEGTVWSMGVAPEGAGSFRALGVAMMVGGGIVLGSFALLAGLATLYLHGSRVRDHLAGSGRRANPMVR